MAVVSLSFASGQYEPKGQAAIATKRWYVTFLLP